VKKGEQVAGVGAAEACGQVELACEHEWAQEAPWLHSHWRRIAAETLKQLTGQTPVGWHGEVDPGEISPAAISRRVTISFGRRVIIIGPHSVAADQ